LDDFLPIKRIDLLELYVGNAKQAAFFYSRGLGFTQIGYSGLETGNRDTASYVMEQGKIRLVLSSPLSPDSKMARFVHLHGDSPAVIALEVPNAESAYHETTKRGATGAIAPVEIKDASGILRQSAIHSYGDVLIKFVDRSDYHGNFAPGFRMAEGYSNGSGPTYKGVWLA